MGEGVEDGLPADASAGKPEGGRGPENAGESPAEDAVAVVVKIMVAVEGTVEGTEQCADVVRDGDGAGRKLAEDVVGEGAHGSDVVTPDEFETVAASGL